MAIPINLNRSLTPSLQEQIYSQIRDLILTGRLAARSRLPSSRELARDLGVSRNTVLFAYDWLENEGYLDVLNNAGVFVNRTIPDHCLADGDTGRRVKVSRALVRTTAPRKPELQFDMRAPARVWSDWNRPSIDFWYGRFDRRNFPLNAWRRLLNENLSRAGKNLSEYGAPNGCVELRQAIAAHLGLTRGISMTPDRIVITAGAQDALNVICRLLVRPGVPVVVENPCYGSAALVLESFGAKLHPVPVDSQGLDTSALAGISATLAYVTPSHQFPTGATIPLERRIQLLNWAENVGAYVIEDDYDSDFRYDSPPLTALAGLDRDSRVIYVGTFSKSIGAGVRVGYLVLPEALIQPAMVVKSLASYGQPWLDQIVIADFMQSGGYRNHIRKLRQKYRQSRDALVTGLKRHFGAKVQLFGQDAGMHILWKLPECLGGAEAVAVAAAAQDVGLYTFDGVGALEFEGSSLARDSLVLGYSSLTAEEVTEGIRRVAVAVETMGKASAQGSDLLAQHALKIGPDGKTISASRRYAHDDPVGRQ
jgi:GntR family transcriptional regulator/MocR family aminotransferase